MSYSQLLWEASDGVAVITVNRPDKLNALNQETMAELADAAARAGADESIRAVIVTGAGPKAFVAGADIGELARQDPIGGQRTSRRGQAVLDTLENLPKPVIAAINGFALGGGLELALACHLRVAAENALLGLPEVSLGIIPGYGGTQRLARLIGPGRAAEMILTARRVEAREAEQIGLVNRVVPAGGALEAARGLAGEILRHGPLAVRFALEAMRHGLEMPLAQGLAFEADRFGLIAASLDMREGMAAFLEKRRASFQGR